MRTVKWLVVLTLAGCSGGSIDDGITLTRQSAERITGSFDDAKGHVVSFDSARVGDELYLDVKNQAGVSLWHIETTPKSYEFSYLGGKLTMHADRAMVAAMKAQAADSPEATSTDAFQFDGDSHALDELLNTPEAAALPWLS